MLEELIPFKETFEVMGERDRQRYGIEEIMVFKIHIMKNI